MTKNPEKFIKKTDWYLGRPKAVQKRILEYPFWTAYKLVTEYGVQKVQILSYTEDKENISDTCQILVPLEWNPFMKETRKVFGVPYSDLIPFYTNLEGVRQLQ